MHSHFDLKNCVVYNLSHNRRMQIDKRIYISLLKAANSLDIDAELYSTFGVRTCAANPGRVAFVRFSLVVHDTVLFL